MVVAALPWVPTAAELGYAALAAGTAAGAVAVKQHLELSRQLAREQADEAQTVGCWKCDDQTCQKLRKQIDGNHEELRKRTKDLVNDPQNLPYRAAGDVAKPSLSVWGHEQLYVQHQEQLREALREYIKLRCGPVRAGAWKRASQGIPKKGQFGFLD